VEWWDFERVYLTDGGTHVGECKLCDEYNTCFIDNDDDGPNDDGHGVCYNGPHVGSATEKATIVRRLRKANMDKADFKEWCIKAKREEDDGSGDSSNDDNGRSECNINDDLDDGKDCKSKDEDDEPPIIGGHLGLGSGSSSDDGEDIDGSR
jgi:hypothetical protein